MPLRKKLVKFGTSRAVILPKHWLEFLEEKTGQRIEYVLLEVNNEIRVIPES
ncbi:hypothetical protein KEJ24_09015 [Candidatus Bathyarchaeota archaeon]|nr:hypothetical protein [Candidatus Bathyarchaeota archaeon]